MSHLIKNINEFIGSQIINETLKSYEIDIVVKKISSLFEKYGLIEKIGYGNNDNSSFYMIKSDRGTFKDLINRYKNPDKDLLEIISDHNMKSEDLVKRYEKDLEEMKYGDIFIFTNYNTPKLSKELLHIIESSGYFIASIDKDIVNIKDDEEWVNRKVKDKTKIEEILLNNKKISISIEPLYDSKVKFDGEYLYHTTDKKYLDKILKYGLIPKSKNTRSFYPERIYLSPNIKYMDEIKYQLNTDKAGEYIDLRIKNFANLSLYKDVRFKGGFYTYDNIPPKYIEVIKIKKEN